MCLKCIKKRGPKLVECCVEKQKNAEGKDVARNLFGHPLGDFRHPLKISLPPLGRNPETAPVWILRLWTFCIHSIFADISTEWVQPPLRKCQ